MWHRGPDRGTGSPEVQQCRMHRGDHPFARWSTGGAALLAAAALVASVAALAPSSPGASGTPSPTTTAERCAPHGTIAPTGTPLVSGPMVKAIGGAPLAVSVSAAATVDAAIRPGGTLTAVVSAQVDLGQQAEGILVDQVRPAIAAAGYPQLAPGAWVVLTLESSQLDLPLPAGAHALGQPAASSPTVGASAGWSADGVRVDLGTLTADTRLGTGAPTTVTVGWRSSDGGAPGPRALDVDAPTLRFTAQVDVGLSFSGAPLVGGVHASWRCTLDAGVPPLGTTVVDASTPTTTGLPGLPASGPPAVVTPVTTTPTTTWPAGATAPACSVSGFDRYGGWTGLQEAATGFFRTQQVSGRWWLIDPFGHPFFSQGVNHVTYAGTADRNGVAAYHDAAVARYGTATSWARAQVARFSAWGYNTAGAWSDDTITRRMPYALLVDLTSEDFSSGVMEDLWDPAWVDHVHATVDAVTAAHRDDPLLLGYWTDNELHWGPDWRPAHLFDEYLDRPATSAGKQHLLGWLEARYPTFAAFAADFTTTATSWADLAAPSTVATWTRTGGQATRAAWVGEVAERYFSVTVGSLRAADPHHLELGPRFIAQTTGTPVLEAARRWVDVASFNDYAIDPALLPGLRGADPTYLGTAGGLAAQEAVVAKPILVSEWGFRAADSGLPNTWPPLFPTLQTQGQRAGAYQRFDQQLLDTTWVVGQHWFEHADEPAAGRFDGEDSNFGLVDANDDPYPDLVQVSRWMHDCAYARLVPTAPPGSTTSTTTTTPAAAPSTEPAWASGAEPVAGEATFTG